MGPQGQYEGRVTAEGRGILHREKGFSLVLLQGKTELRWLSEVLTNETGPSERDQNSPSNPNPTRLEGGGVN